MVAVLVVDVWGLFVGMFYVAALGVQLRQLGVK